MACCSEKSVVRAEMRARRKALSPVAKAHATAVIGDRILLHAAVRSALDEKAPIAVYLASSDEIDLTAAIRALLDCGGRVVVPCWNGATYDLAELKGFGAAHLRKGPMGIPEPVEPVIVRPQDVRVWLVPGLAFTRAGGRLGYGGGWYDRLMAEAGDQAIRLGVTYGFQIVDTLPVEPHDIRLDGLVDDSP